MELHNEEIRMSFAAFIYYIDKKNYKINKYAGCISFWYDKNKEHILQFIPDDYGCGFVVINSKDVLETMFQELKNNGGYDDFITELFLCKREYGPSGGETVLLHCKIPLSERKNIKTTVNGDEIIKCVNKNKP